MATLPTPGGDNNTWGDELNEWLLVGHNADGTTIGGGGGSGETIEEDITQTAHGLAVGDWVRLSGDNYVTAQANSVGNAEVVGVVTAVSDANNFTVTAGGKVSGLSGLTAGTVYFLSASSAGDITSTEPSSEGQISKPVLVADSTTSGWLFNMRGAVVATQDEIAAGLVNYLFAR